MQEKAIDYITEQEYLDMERESEIKHEYFDGEIFAMTGASEKHNLIVTNIIRELSNLLRKTPCRIYPGDMRLKIEETGLYTYPDVMIACKDRRFGDEARDTLLNPDVIIEVLSDSTESYDRGKKFENYRKIPSLKEYVLISQHHEKIERFYKNENGQWVLTESDAQHPKMALESVGSELLVSAVYEKVWD
jgi:Uma2 family endonuclease